MKKNRSLRWLHLAALTAALAAVVLVASGISFWHNDAGSDATCPICHVAHISALPKAPANISAALTTIAWLVTAEAQAGHARAFSILPPPRAPPA